MTPDLLPQHMQQRIVVTDSGCWQWTASFTRGYGRVSMSRPGTTLRRWSAHRLAYELLVGPIPDGLQIDHLCRNRACIYPAHLEPVTALENVRRSERISSAQGRKTHCPYGHPYDAVNTRVNSQGSRVCRTCARERQRKARALA